MLLGWCWFDNDKKKPIEQKVQEAKTHYERKFGLVPNVCYVNDSVPKGIQAVLELRRAQYILPFHFWLGIVENYEDHSDSPD